MPEPSIDRQLPVGDEIFLDHVGHFVSDLESAGARLERLGFAVSPINLQQNADPDGTLKPSGTSNRIAILRRGFIEVLAATHDTPLADQLKQALARYAGLHLIALSHADVPAQRARLTALGFPMQDIINLRRHVITPEGLREVRWSVLRPQSGVMPEGRVQYAYCHTPELTWPENGPMPRNGADTLTDILVCVTDRREAADRLGRFAGRKAVEHGAFSIVPLERGKLVLIERTVAESLLQSRVPTVPFMAGQALRSIDLARTRKALARGGITPLFDGEELVCVGPADGIGSYLLFHAPAVTAPWIALAAAGRA